jgi:hypothetical protein
MKAKYEGFLALKAEMLSSKGHTAHLERQVEYLLEQMRLSHHRQFVASNEKSEYGSAHSETKLMASPALAEPELVEVEKHCRLGDHC